jgi:hypothetical protein
MYYNVTLRRVRQLLLLWKNNKYCIFVFGHVHARACLNLAYPACNSYTPYCDVIYGPLWLHHIFRQYLTNGAIFGKKKLFNIKCVF